MITIKQKDTTVNLKLAEKQGLSNVNVKKIHQLHIERDIIIEKMKKTPKIMPKYDEKQKLRELLKQYRNIQTKLKNQWKFDNGDKYEQEYLLPWCTCPVMDNEDDFYGVSEQRWVNEDCPYHGKD